MAEFGLPENPFDFKKEDWLQWWSLKEDDGLEYEILNVINRGSFGVVYRGRDRRTNETVALKEELGGLSRSTMMEIDILESLPRHPNIVEFKKVLSEGGRIMVVMEYLEHDLNKVKKRMGGPFPLHILKAVMAHILKGVAFLHEEGVMHRDLKPGNILFGGRTIKICDFGLSARLGSPWGRRVGTRWYKAPEVLDGWRSYTSAVDLWSVGCILAEFALGKHLFRGRSDAHQLACIQEMLCGSANQLRLFMSTAASFSGATALTPSGLDLLERLLAYYPWKRISARDALNHPWFFED